MVVPAHQYSPMMTGQQAYPVQMQFLPPAFAGNASNNTHHFDTLMSENRIHSSEVRMHLCRLTDKIDLLLQKVSAYLHFQLSKVLKFLQSRPQFRNLIQKIEILLLGRCILMHLRVIYKIFRASPTSTPTNLILF